MICSKGPLDKGFIFGVFHVEVVPLSNYARKRLYFSEMDTPFTKLVPNDPFDYKWKLVIVCSGVSSIDEVDCIGDENKESIFKLVSLILNTGIHNIRKTGHGVIPREGEGAQCHMIMPAMTCSGVMKSGGRKLNKSEIQELKEVLVQSKRLKNHVLINTFSYAIRIDEPIVQFMLLYLILYELFKDQKSIDKYIMTVSPSALQVPSPHNNKLETIYTKLRNEITHRVDSSPDETKKGILSNIHGLKQIVQTAILEKIKQ